jgi:anti-sigma factor RsiW
MKEEPPTPMNHPDEFLAAYLDGTGSPAERAEVESHLAVCSDCRQDLDFARSGKEALRSLPELAPPGLARTALPALVTSAVEEQAPVPIERRRARLRSGVVLERVAWGLGVAAVLALLVGIVANLNGTRAKQAALPRAASSEPGSFAAIPSGTPTVVQSNVDYTEESLAALARQIGASTDSKALSAPEVTRSPAPTPVLDTNRDLLDPARALACLQQATGLGSDAYPTYLELASYNATPAYIGAFYSLVDAPHVLVVAVSVDGCQPLRVDLQPL